MRITHMTYVFTEGVRPAIEFTLLRAGLFASLFTVGVCNLITINKILVLCWSSIATS